jgi:putative RecB family exonuclease
LNACWRKPKEVRKMEHLSNSQINLYLQCSLKYKFQYIDLIPKPFKGSGLALGGAIHSSISWFHKQKMNGNGVTLDKLFRIFRADWYSQKVDAELRFKEGEDEMKVTVMGKEMLARYFEDPLKNVKATDVHFNIPLINPAKKESLGINLEGFFDAVEKDEIIAEFKTSGQTMDAREVHDHLQLTIYSYAYEMLYQRPPKLLKLIEFVKTKKPKMIMFETTRTRADYQRFFHLASQVLRGIRSGIFFPRSSFLCKDCEYEAPCRRWGENGRG